MSSIGLALGVLSFLLFAHSSAIACDKELLRIAADIDHPASYARAGSEHCEGRYGGLFSSSRDTFVKIVGFDRRPTVEMFDGQDTVSFEWQSGLVEAPTLSVVYLQPRLFFRMDASPSQPNRFQWPLARLASIQGGQLQSTSIAVAVAGRDPDTGSEVLLPVSRSQDDMTAPFRVSLEALVRFDELDWALIREVDEVPVANGRLSSAVARNQFVQLDVPVKALEHDGRYELRLTATLPNGAIAVQRAVVANPSR